MTSRDDAHHRVAGQFPVSLALDCRSPVAGASAGSPEDDRVRRAGQNARHCTADLRPNPAAARLILIPQHIDKLIGAVGSGPLDARALDLQRVVLLAGPSADAGETDRPDHALLQAEPGISVLRFVAVHDWLTQHRPARAVSYRFSVSCGRAGPSQGRRHDRQLQRARVVARPGGAAPANRDRLRSSRQPRATATMNAIVARATRRASGASDSHDRVHANPIVRPDSRWRALSWPSDGAEPIV